MVHFCAVFGCSNRSNRETGKRYYRLPAIKKNVNKELQMLQEQRRNEWLKRIGREDLNLKTPEKFPNTRICSEHFISGEPASLIDTENPDWAPSKQLGHDLGRTPTKVRRARNILKEQRRLRAESAEALLQLSEKLSPVQNVHMAPAWRNKPAVRESSTQTDLTLQHLYAWEMEMNRLRQENSELKQKLKDILLDKDSFKEEKI
ncbi:uncharacterized protein LOC132871453 [Neoarius graeffei]|uniref:uncharacterized protein LOC132871453 n=1 Tax=Neoarius graeffei TaxID=443677 RepID=UPI00298C7F61|nr:uncharacterized protein LOC132871453 [Neoarius graeffei]